MSLKVKMINSPLISLIPTFLRLENKLTRQERNHETSNFWKSMQKGVLSQYHQQEAENPNEPLEDWDL